MPPPAEAVPAQWLVPDWNVDARVRGFVTTRHGGVSQGPFASLNLGRGATGVTRDDPQAVEENRRRVAAHLPGPARWLRQVHGAAVLEADRVAADAHAGAPPSADAAITRCANVPLVVLVADCLPVLLAARDGSVIGVAHAGWRGLAAGVVEATVRAMRCAGGDIEAWLGPCIGPRAFQVGDDVRDAFMTHDSTAARHFTPRGGKWLADLPGLARDRLATAGVHAVHGGDWCTVEDRARFFSYRRDGATGRMGAFLWIAARADARLPDMTGAKDAQP
jgi:YfiH family protein